MKTLTDLALNKMANNYLSSLSHVLYKLNGAEAQTYFQRIELNENTVISYIVFGDSSLGTISNIRVIDKDGDIVAQDPKVYERVSAKALYVAFKHEFTEV